MGDCGASPGRSSLPPGFATVACPMFARLVWSKEAPDHVNPGVRRDACRGRLFKFVSGLAFSSKLCPGYDASILDQLPVWPSVPRRSDACHPGMAMGLGDPLRLTSVNSATTGHLSARGLWPADIQQWPFGNRAFFWRAHDASFSANGWSARPKMAVAG